ncbi:MAG: hypothetical protein RL120_04725 [Gammaproteobacteria bacterium]
MNNRPVTAVSLCLAMAVSQLAVGADYRVPRTQWGQPDLQGVWNFASEVPMQRPEEFGDRLFLTDEEIAANQAPSLAIGNPREPRRSANGIEAFYNDTMWMERARGEDSVRTSLIVHPANGRLPNTREGIGLQPGGERDTTGRRPVRFVVGGIGRDGPEDRGLSERCLVGFNAAPQLMPSVYNNNVQIIQNRDHVVILAEMVHDARIVKLELGTQLDERIGLWSGDSRGFWEGDTLVVITRNFNGLTQSFDGYGSSAKKLLTERFTRVGDDTIEYEFTIEDPATFRDRITAVVPLTKTPLQLYEYACHEGNYGMGNMLRAARARDATAETDRVAELFRDR